MSLPTDPVQRRWPALEQLAPTLRDRRNPLVIWSFLLFAAIVMLNLNGVVAMSAKIGQVFTLALFGLALVVLLAAGMAPKRDLSAPGLAYFAFLIVYIAVGSLANSFDSGFHAYSHQLWMLSAGALTVYVSAVGCRHLLLSTSPRSTMFWLSLIAICAVASVLAGTVWPELYELLPRRVAFRHSGLFKNPNDAGVIANITATFCLGRMLSGRRPLVHLVAVAMCGVAVILTFSRTAMVIYSILLVGTIVIACSKVQRGDAGARSRRALVFVAALFAACVFGWFVLRGVNMLGELRHGQRHRLDTFTNLAQGRELDEALSNRLPVFKLGMKYWSESPLVGHGLGVGSSMSYEGGNIGTHNTWLMILVDSGLLPALLFALFGVLWLREAWRCELPTVRVVAFGYFFVFWLAVLSSHTTLTKRTENVALGCVIGLMAADRQLRRRRALILREAESLDPMERTLQTEPTEARTNTDDATAAGYR